MSPDANARDSMTLPSLAHIELAQCLLALELEREHDHSHDQDVIAATSRVYEKLQAQMVRLLGKNGFHSLMQRSARLQQGDFECFGHLGIVDSSASLATGLSGISIDQARDATTALFGTLIALLITFIGERLMNEVLRGAWPKLPSDSANAIAVKETEK